MTHQRRLSVAVLLLVATCIIPAQGCYKVLIFPYKTCFNPNIDVGIKKLEAELEQIEARYEREVEMTKDYISRRKELIDGYVDSKDYGLAIKELDTLWVATHPCEVHDCKKLRKEAEDPTKVSSHVKDHDLLDKARINREDRYIKSTLKTILAQSEARIEQGLYNDVDMSLAPIQSVKMTYSVRDDLADLQKSAKSLWVERSEKRAAALEQKLPGAAFVHYKQAARLSESLGDAARASKNAAKAKALRAQIARDNAFSVAVFEATGPGADTVASMTPKLTGYHPYVSWNANKRAVKAGVSFSIGEPAFSRSTKSGQDSFRYKSGSHSEPNPAYVKAKDKCDYYTKEYEAELVWCRSNYDAAGCGDNPAWSERDFMEEACGAVRGYSPTVQVDDFADYSFPTTIHRLEGQAQFVAKCVWAASKPAIELDDGEAVQVTLQDVEHESYSMAGSGVKRDPASPPTESQGTEAVYKRAATKVGLLVNGTAQRYRNSLIERAQGGEDEQLDGYATFAILDPKTAPKEVYQKIEALADTTGASALFE